MIARKQTAGAKRKAETAQAVSAYGCRLEAETAGDLQVTRAVIYAGGYTKPGALRRVAGRKVRKTHPVTVKDVKGFALELECESVLDVEVLDEADILGQVDRACDGFRHASKVSECERSKGARRSRGSAV